MEEIKVEIYNQLMLNWVEHDDTYVNRCSFLRFYFLLLATDCDDGL